MKILHIINDRPSDLSDTIIALQAKEHEVKVVEMSKKDRSYESIIDDIFSHDRVISW
jgi:hypothetical protein